jgi:polysaccharide biosynthesis transport protein
LFSSDEFSYIFFLPTDSPHAKLRLSILSTRVFKRVGYVKEYRPLPHEEAKLTLANRPPAVTHSPRPSDGPQGGTALDLAWLLGLPARRWKVLLIVPLFTLLAVYGALRIIPPVYQSGVQILVFDPQQQDINVIAQQGGQPRGYDGVAANTEIEVIRSQSMMLRVVKDLSLDQNPEFQAQGFGSKLPSWLRPSRYLGSPRYVGNGEPGEDKIAIAAAILRTKIAVDRTPLSYILNVSARSRDPLLAKQIAETLLNDYLSEQQKARQESLDQMAVWVKAKLADLKARSTETGTAIEKLKAEGGFSDAGKDSSIERQIADLNAQLTAARADVADKTARLEQARQLPAVDGSTQNIPDLNGASPLINQLRLQQSILTQRQAQLKAKFGPGHAAVTATESQLESINQALADETARMRADLQNLRDIAQRREKSLEAELQRLAAARGSSDDHVKLQELQRIADANGKVYDSYLAQYNAIESSKSRVGSNERVISAAEIPDEPVFPRRGLILLGGAIGGVLAGFVIAFLADYLSSGMKMGAEAEEAYGVPVLGNVPLHRTGRTTKQVGGKALVQDFVNTPLSPFSESVRAVRLGLRLSNQDETPKIIMVTSSLPGEGKSTLSTLLAASSVAAGNRTVLVDCDVRGRSISRDFGKKQLGLTDLLAGTASLDDVIVRHPDVGCFVIPAGTLVQSLSDHAGSSRMTDLLSRLREKFDYIVIDTPPVLSVVDAVAFAGLADKILVTVDSQRTRHVSVSETFRMLRPETGRIGGIVFNKVAPEQYKRYGMHQYAKYVA